MFAFSLDEMWEKEKRVANYSVTSEMPVLTQEREINAISREPNGELVVH